MAVKRPPSPRTGTVKTTTTTTEVEETKKEDETKSTD